MAEVQAVQLYEPSVNEVYHSFGDLLREWLIDLIDVFLQISFVAELQDGVLVLLVLEGLVEFDDVGVLD